MSKRVRVVGWNIQPILMLDDGENLTALEVQPRMIAAADWQDFKDGGDEKALKQVEEQLASVDT